MKMLLQTDGIWSATMIRITVGMVMFPHGAQKLLGWYGGYGWNGSMTYFTETVGLASIVAALVILGESLGAVALISGFMTRFVAGSLGVIMMGAVTIAHWEHGFFMNWFGQQQGEGFEFHLLIIGMCIALVFSGGGKWSVDRAIAEDAR